MQRKPDQVTTGSAGEHVHGPNCNHDHHQDPVVETYRRETPKLGRNDPCLCGSGKKFKKCHGGSP